MANIEDLEKRNNVLKEILNSSWDGIAIISTSGKFTYVNKAFIPLFAYEQKELLKIGFLDLLTNESKENFKDLLSQNDTAQTYNNKLELEAKRKDDKTIYVSVSIQLMTNKKMFILNVSDITEITTKRNQINKFIITLDLNKDLELTKATEAFYKMTSFTKDEVINKNYKSLLSPMSVPFQNENLEKNMKDKIKWEGKLIIKQKDGSSFNVEAVCNPVLNKYSDVISYSLIMVNTSNYTSDKEKSLEKMLVDEEEKLSIMSDTMRTVAHEWRQPLNSISLRAQELIFELDFEDDIDKEKIKDHLERITENTKDLSGIIQSFQNVTNIEGSKKKRNIKEIVNESLKMADLFGQWINVENGPSSAFRTYPKELAAAFSSILINANEALSNKKDKKIDIKTYDDGENIVCEISNNGGNIPHDIISKIFTPYFSTKDIANGVGLSLYVCKIVVELHLKGTLEVKNIEDHSVEFRLTFPKGALE